MTPGTNHAGRRYVVKVGTQTFAVTLASSPEGGRIAIVDGDALPLSAVPTYPPGTWSILLGDRSFDVGVHAEESLWAATVAGRTYEVDVADEAVARFRRTGHAGASAGGDVVKAPMPGLVVAIPVAVGERVEAGAPLLVLEAMKMQNELVASHEGVVRAIRVTVGQKVDKGQTLVVVTP